MYFQVKLAEDVCETEVQFGPRKTAGKRKKKKKREQNQPVSFPLPQRATYLRPRQLRGPLENATSHLSSSLPWSPSHLSGRNSSGFGKMVPFRCTKWLLISTTVCKRPKNILATSDHKASHFRPGVLSSYPARHENIVEGCAGRRHDARKWRCNARAHSKRFLENGRLPGSDCLVYMSCVCFSLIWAQGCYQVRQFLQRRQARGVTQNRPRRPNLRLQPFVDGWRRQDVERAVHQGGARGIGAAEQQRLRFFIETAGAWSGAGAMRLRTKELVIYGRRVR